MAANHLFVGLDPPAVYAGDVVRGVVVLVCADPAPLQDLVALTVAVSGTEYVRWAPLVPTDTDEELAGRVGVAACHGLVRTLWARGAGVTNDAAAPSPDLPGTHTYRFEFALPGRLPGTYQEQRRGGRRPGAAADWFMPSKTSWLTPVWTDPTSGIEYAVTATALARGPPGSAPTATVTTLASSAPLHVWERIDTPLLTSGPVTCANEKTFLFAGKDPLHLRVTLPRGVFFAGEDVVAQVAVRNATSKTVDGLLFKVRTLVAFHADGHTLERVVFEDVRRHNAVVAGPRSDMDTDVRLRLVADDAGRPLSALATVARGRLVNVRHELCVEACVAKGFNLSVALPLHIVAVPAVGPRPSLLDLAAPPPDLPTVNRPLPPRPLPPRPVSEASGPRSGPTPMLPASATSAPTSPTSATPPPPPSVKTPPLAPSSSNGGAGPPLPLPPRPGPQVVDVLDEMEEFDSIDLLGSPPFLPLTAVTVNDWTAPPRPAPLTPVAMTAADDQFTLDDSLDLVNNT